MKFDFSKSREDLQNKYSDTFQELVLNELRAQRNDLVTIRRQLNRLINDFKLQKQVDEYYDEKPPTEVTESNLDGSGACS